MNYLCPTGVLIKSCNIKILACQGPFAFHLIWNYISFGITSLLEYNCCVFIWKSILITNTPWQGPIYPCRGPKVPLSGTGTPPGGLVLSFQYMQLYLIGLADGLLSVNPSPQVTTCIIGQLIP